MACGFSHDWGWPRRRGDLDLQVCSRCGVERPSPIQFVSKPVPPRVGTITAVRPKPAVGFARITAIWRGSAA